MARLREKQKGNKSGQNSESSDEPRIGMHFKDNEEERMHDFDEDFDEGFSFQVDKVEHRKENIDVDDDATSQPPNCMFTTKEIGR